MKFKTEEVELLKTINFDEHLLEVVLEFKNGDIREAFPIREGEFFEQLEDLKGIEFEVYQGKSNLALQNISDCIKNKGYQVYFSVFNDLNTTNNTVSILKTYDKMGAIRFNATNGINHAISSNDIIDKLKKWDYLYGLELSGANRDWVMFRLNTLPKDLDAYVDELCEFCPDYLYQDNYSERGIDWSKFMIRSLIYYNKIIRLWWD